MCSVTESGVVSDGTVNVPVYVKRNRLVPATRETAVIVIPLAPVIVRSLAEIVVSSGPIGSPVAVFPVVGWSSISKYRSVAELSNRPAALPLTRSLRSEARIAPLLERLVNVPVGIWIVNVSTSPTFAMASVSAKLPSRKRTHASPATSVPVNV